MYTVHISYKLHGIAFEAQVKTPAFSQIDACKVVELCAVKMFQGISDIQTRTL